MNNIELISKVLQYIDDHISEAISFKTLADIYGYSSFHFHRIFTAITNLTMTNYIKERRLKLVYNYLLDNDLTVSEVCFKYGFNSIQTFNRCFKDMFGLTPTEVRSLRSKIEIQSIDDIIRKYQKRITIDGDYTLTPRFVEKSSFLLAGLRKHTSEGWQVIGESWSALKANWDKLDRVNSFMYGFEDYSEDFLPEPMQFYYMAAAEVRDVNNLPNGFSVKKIPAAMYAVFTVNGNNSNNEIGRVFRYIYDVWLPNSEYYINDEITADFEFYDERWDCMDGNSQVDLYIPIKRMECGLQ